MTPVSHALLPIFIGQRWIPCKNGIPNFRVVLLVALAGVLPDILSPHLSLDDRHTAYSHTIFAVFIFSLVFTAFVKWQFKSIDIRVISLCLLAYAGHIFCDLITGGVALFYPFSTTVTGKNYLPYWLWLTSDGLLIIYLYLTYRWIPLRKRFKVASQSDELLTP